MSVFALDDYIDIVTFLVNIEINIFFDLFN